MLMIFLAAGPLFVLPMAAILKKRAQQQISEDWLTDLLLFLPLDPFLVIQRPATFKKGSPTT